MDKCPNKKKVLFCFALISMKLKFHFVSQTNSKLKKQEFCKLNDIKMINNTDLWNI